MTNEDLSGQQLPEPETEPVEGSINEAVSTEQESAEASLNAAVKAGNAVFGVPDVATEPDLADSGLNATAKDEK